MIGSEANVFIYIRCPECDGLMVVEREEGSDEVIICENEACSRYQKEFIPIIPEIQLKEVTE